ncbi:hypothetical protein AaE_015546 [Aphanomyces astaci]|uniref:Rhodanese domain-containing protein n=1 Tax=Aphanomyces astaci TaxID=112090 RepID=A0A6A4Z111_APHAT|nr:hypothetical protein AaE_015546 [Aphanomyces astaci]
MAMHGFAALPSDEVARYSRQLLVKDFGVEGQKKLLKSRVLVVGAGGLGCPVLLYLSGMGVGHLGIVDGDHVDMSNLHRQVLHTPANVGQLKVESAQAALHLRSPSVAVEVFPVHMDTSNAADIMHSYDVVVDASDNVATRYLVNDMCCLMHKPLVSGSALGMEGQVSVFNFQGGPCYRCCFPTPTPQTMAGTCSEQGVLGVVPGIIGSLQAMETVKVISGLGRVLSGVQCTFDAWDMTFRHYKLPLKRPQCNVCGISPTIRSALESAASVRPLVCELPSPVDASHIVTVHILASLLQDHPDLVLVDVRERVHYDICHLVPSINIPLADLPASIPSLVGSSSAVAVICRRGMDSTHAVHQLVAAGRTADTWHVAGGLVAWSRHIDISFPAY